MSSITKTMSNKLKSMQIQLAENTFLNDHVIEKYAGMGCTLRDFKAAAYYGIGPKLTYYSFSYIEYEKVEGVTLHEYAKEASIQQIASIMWKLFVIIDDFGYDICHNDLHSFNIIVTPSQEIILIDWEKEMGEQDETKWSLAFLEEEKFAPFKFAFKTFSYCYC